METATHIRHLRNKFKADKIFFYQRGSVTISIYYWKDRDYFIFNCSKDEKAFKLPLDKLDQIQEKISKDLQETFIFNQSQVTEEE